ncbi:hypothetical protein NDU88_003573 [Pleurodeles waltl]|uniref:Uncharacterized protein n=1 Tax=Pleurodeles waltl TaxID=8319 RepID=A0AAV7T524_PLEWA|nr:hypothetical protein NDU88_003573 [Pleurodeles waltl]
MVERLGGKVTAMYPNDSPKEERSSSAGGRARPSTAELPHVLMSIRPPRSSNAENGKATRTIRIRTPQSHPSVWNHRKHEPPETWLREEGQTKSDTASLLTLVGRENEPRAPVSHLKSH